MFRVLQCALLLLLAVVDVHTQGSCYITNTSGKRTDLSGMTAFHWTGPDKAGGSIEYEWEISPCKLTEGICESTDYDGYIQQSAAGGKRCAKNAWFATYTAGSGGQGEDISLSYTGNEIINPPMGRKGEITITCDPSGQPGQITQCTVDTENNGKDWVFTFTCTGNIACASNAPMPYPPSPAPGPSPLSPSTPMSSCAVAVWQNNGNCTNEPVADAVLPNVARGVCISGAGRESMIITKSGNYVTVFGEPNCSDKFIGVFPTNRCVDNIGGVKYMSMLVFCV